MTYTITTAEVEDGFISPVSDADLTAYIAVVDQADSCLTANSVSAAIGKQLKILAVRHLATDALGGSVVSERAISGASRTFAERPSGETSHLSTLRQIDTYGCVLGVVNKNSYVQFRSVGRRSPT